MRHQDLPGETCKCGGIFQFVGTTDVLRWTTDANGAPIAYHIPGDRFECVKCGDEIVVSHDYQDEDV